MADAVQNPSAKTADGQGSVVPLGWKPSASAPVPVVRCTVIKKSGERCKRWSLRGSTKCVSHLRGAMNFDNFAKHTEAVLESARLRLVDDTDMAIDTLEDLMQPGTAEGIRLKAATEILDRAGIRGGFEIEVEVEHKEDPATVLAKRLETLRGRGQAALDAAVTPGDVIDAVVIEDETPQAETLF